MKVSAPVPTGYQMQTLCTNGPFNYFQHPIYTALLGCSLSTPLVLDSTCESSMCGVCVCVCVRVCVCACVCACACMRVCLYLRMYRYRYTYVFIPTNTHTHTHTHSLTHTTGSVVSPVVFWAYVKFLVVPREIRYMRDKFGAEYDLFAKKCVCVCTCTCMCRRMCTCTCMCVSVFVCVREIERERESVCVCVCVSE